MELYHITKGKYLTSILTEGLKINSGKTGFCKKNVHKEYKQLYNMQPIFLTNSVEFISKKMLTNGWVDRYKPIVLKVEVEINDENSNFYQYEENFEEIAPKEYRYFFNIKPKHIQMIEVDLKSFNLEF